MLTLLVLGEGFFDASNVGNNFKVGDVDDVVEGLGTPFRTNGFVGILDDDASEGGLVNNNGATEGMYEKVRECVGNGCGCLDGLSRGC